MSTIPEEDVALAAEVLSDNEIVLAILRTVRNIPTDFPQVLNDRVEGLVEKYEGIVHQERHGNG